MNAPTAASATAAAAGLLLGLHGLLAVRVRIKCFPLRQGHIQPFGFISGFQLGTASCEQEQRNYDEPPLHEMFCFTRFFRRRNDSRNRRTM
jgi:hypothetical protein